MPGYIIWVPANPIPEGPRLSEEEYVYAMKEFSTHSKDTNGLKNVWERIINRVSRTFKRTVESVSISKAP